MVRTVARWVEVHRLAVAGGQAGIARDLGNRVGRVWLARSRFADVARLAEQTLSLGPHADAFYHLGWARSATGFPVQALAACDQALRLYRANHDRGNEAATLNNIGNVYDHLGDHQQALNHYQQALPIQREVGDRAGEATTLNNIALIRYRDGDLVGAKDVMDRVLGLIQAVGDLGSEAQFTFNIAVLLLQMKRANEAIVYQRRAVDLAVRTEHSALGRMQEFLIQLEQSAKE